MSSKLIKRFGTPKDGYTWCSGYKRPEHQVLTTDMAHLGRCKTCKKAYLAEYFARRHAADYVPETPVPGNNGGFNLPQWGYRCAA